MEVVYDVKLVLKKRKLYASEVDLSRYGLLRRMGLTGLAQFIYSLADKIREQTISWSYIQRLPEDLGRFRGDVRLNVLRERLSDMHPVDLADILEEMDHDQRVEVFDALEPEQASDTLEEIEPSVQRDLVSSLDVEKVGRLVGDMTTAQAADVLSILSASDADDILALVDPEDARKIKAIMDEQEANILNYATQQFLSVSPGWRAEQAQEFYRVAAKGKDVVMYLYIVDDDKKLLGVLDIKELLQAEDRARLGSLMETNVVSLHPDSTLREAAGLFARYDFRALPITGDDGKILGVVMHRDVMGLKHRFVE